ncbi:MAG TPA: zinc-binding alcohol dehydrogenase family protein [Candidatus Limnocylindria bacterium]|nr:zinc-binding alcohol dehydrogenase family protein [Candidatus Limnocylindria bacterium]
MVRRAAEAPRSGELLLRIDACGVCRTDLQIVEGDLAPHKLPLIPGHQVVGHVEAVADDVSGWKVGDRAGAIWLAWACGECVYCRTERENLCPSARFTGWDVDGGYATRMSVVADFAVRIPDAFDDTAAAPLLCGGVIGYRALRLAGLAPGLRLGLYGFGASASLAIQVAVHRGAVVHVATRSQDDRRRALQLGALSAGGYDEPPPQPLDAAITFAPVGSVVVDALRALAPGGRVVINAIHLDRIPEFDYELLWSERSLQSVANVTRRDASEFLALAAEIPIRTDFRIYPLADANAALADLAAGRVGKPAAVLTP